MLPLISNLALISECSLGLIQTYPTLWALDQPEFKFGVATLWGCEEKRMQSWMVALVQSEIYCSL